MTSKVKPALIGGGAIGLLSVFTAIVSVLPVPFVNNVGCCKCLWPIAGGLLATMLYVKGSPHPASISDGAIVGALAGVIGGLINMVIGLPIIYFVNGTEALDLQVRQMSPDFPLTGGILFALGGIVGFFSYVVLAAIGGLIGVPLFEKRKGTVNGAPPSQNFGGGPGGT